MTETLPTDGGPLHEITTHSTIRTYLHPSIAGPAIVGEPSYPQVGHLEHRYELKRLPHGKSWWHHVGARPVFLPDERSLVQ